MRVLPSLLTQIRVDCSDEVGCPCCDAVLDRHQPDSERPERQLGTCLACGSWFLIDEAAGVMYALPEVWSDLNLDGE